VSRGDPLRIRDYLEHIAQAIANIRDYTAGMDTAAYLADKKTQDAVVRNFEAIGEACNNVTKHMPLLRGAILRFHGTSRTRCGMRYPMDISKSITALFGGR
jgi:uncharacterized protein with HEPN domain